MVRTMIQGAGLPNTYWSYALLHAVYLKNRLPHKAVKNTPHEMYTKSDLSHLRVFGSFVTSNLSHGIFLGYTAIDRNINFRDEVSNQIKLA